MDDKYRDEHKALGLNIAYYRKLLGLTQEQLAQKISISRTHISNIEAVNVTKSPSINTLLHIRDALGVEFDQLFEIRRNARPAPRNPNIPNSPNTPNNTDTPNNPPSS
jgi:transcriptional regulator with XRE-family HTH domain